MELNRSDQSEYFLSRVCVQAASQLHTRSPLNKILYTIMASVWGHEDYCNKSVEDQIVWNSEKLTSLRMFQISSRMSASALSESTKPMSLVLPRWTMSQQLQDQATKCFKFNSKKLNIECNNGLTFPSAFDSFLWCNSSTPTQHLFEELRETLMKIKLKTVKTIT